MNHAVSTTIKYNQTYYSHDDEFKFDSSPNIASKLVNNPQP